MANRSLGVEQGNQSTGQGLARYGEGQSAARAYDLAGNRQGVAANAANARRQGQQEYRNWSTGQTNQAVGNQQQATGQRIQNYGTQAGAVNQSTGQYGQYDLGRRGQGFGNAFKQSFGHALGSGLGSAPWASRG